MLTVRTGAEKSVSGEETDEGSLGWRSMEFASAEMLW